LKTELLYNRLLHVGVGAVNDLIKLVRHNEHLVNSVLDTVRISCLEVANTVHQI
jgi:hypothetical protein